jgi:hypothetical protein
MLRVGADGLTAGARANGDEQTEHPTAANRLISAGHGYVSSARRSATRPAWRD